MRSVDYSSGIETLLFGTASGAPPNKALEASAARPRTGVPPAGEPPAAQRER